MAEGLDLGVILRIGKRFNLGLLWSEKFDSISRIFVNMDARLINWTCCIPVAHFQGLLLVIEREFTARLWAIKREL